MSSLGEQHPIDVTTLPPRQDLPPQQDSPPKRPKERRPVGAALGSFWGKISTPAALLNGVALQKLKLWLRRPFTQAAALVLVTVFAIGVIVARSLPPSVDGPARTRQGWRASASGMGRLQRHASNPAAALDGNPDTRWTTERGQRNSDWFAVDMGRMLTFHEIVLDAGKNADECPQAFAVYVSNDGIHWGTSVATGAGQGALTVASFTLLSARYIKVVQTGQDRRTPWSICEFTVH